MNDPIKGFVEKHREDFDHLEAPEFDLAAFKARLNKSEVLATAPIKVWYLKPMAIAAAILVLLAAGLTVFKLQYPQQREQLSARKPVTVESQSPRKTTEQHVTPAPVKVVLAAAQPKIPKRKLIKASVNKVESNYNQLSDSTSSSTRLAAVLDIGKSDRVSYDTFDRLLKTIENDGSSNVRLAAVAVLDKYKTDGYVSKLLVSALNNQHDPMVQLALVNMLGKMEHVKIEDKLYALVNDPATFGAVKDEAYSILLKENKL